jgi:two-component system chemotaxis response regulator CheY
MRFYNMSKKILIIDDSVFMCKSVRDIFSTNGYEVVGDVQDGAQALTKFKELTPDIVILDLIMPPEKGLDILKNILKEDPKARVLVLTAVGDHSVMIEVIKAGAMGYINKPFQAKALIDEVKKILNK